MKSNIIIFLFLFFFLCPIKLKAQRLIEVLNGDGNLIPIKITLTDNQSKSNKISFETDTDGKLKIKRKDYKKYRNLSFKITFVYPEDSHLYRGRLYLKNGNNKDNDGASLSFKMQSLKMLFKENSNIYFLREKIVNIDGSNQVDPDD